MRLLEDGEAATWRHIIGKISVLHINEDRFQLSRIVIPQIMLISIRLM